MKFKPSRIKDTVTVDLGPRDRRLPAAVLSSIHLKNILVPIDFSGCSRKALRYAIPFARQFEANVILLYVVRTPSVTAEAEVAALPLLETQMIESGKRELAAWAKKEVGNDVKAATLVRAGSPYHEIVETAKAKKVDLIILSTHGRTGLKHVFLGSTAESVVRYAPCPVLVVREHEQEFVPE
jgi:nucleotide-binding universal stress UspA family protein